MTEMIEVRYKDTGVRSSTNKILYHKYIVYTDDSGIEHYARGGTTLKNLQDQKITPISPMGVIETEHGLFLNDTVDYPGTGEIHSSEAIASGSDLSGKWQKIVEAMDYINSLELSYFPSRNSNSVADTALSYAGLPLPVNDDRGDDYFAPGSGYILPTPDNPPEGLLPSSWLPYLPDWVPGVTGSFGSAEVVGSPLVIDVDGDGIELSALNGTGAVYWDIDADGFREASGWIAGGDGLLALDRSATRRCAPYTFG